ncbi:MAG: hypothetical protein ACOCV8_00030 [Spirochaetota bacterium]
MAENTYIIGSLIKFSVEFCKGRDINLDNINIPSNVEDDKWYDFDIFMKIVKEIEKQNNVLGIEELGKTYFFVLDTKDYLKDVSKLKTAVGKMYNIYQLFFNGERSGIWRAEDISHSGYIRIKENSILPPYFTKGFLTSVSKAIGCVAVRVKIVEDMREDRGENESEMNIYDISWMNKIK